ncbi:MAG: Fic family protein, partial [Lysobacterales bacterium]
LLEKACKDSDPAVLHLPLEKTPDILLRIVNEELRSMEKLAVACSELKGDESQFKYKADTRHLEFMEAWTNCNQEEDLEAMANAFATLGDQSGATIITGNRNLNAVYRACTMRKRQPLGQSLDERSESWIRYWHAKLMDGDVANLPGQFKAIPNVISSGSPVSTVSPECICATLKTVFQEIRPRVPAGLKRALFTETALIKLHAFVDGNGRISRFIFNWEMESAGLDARLVTPLSKNCLPTSLDQAILNINVNQLYEDFCRIYDDGNLQLETFNHFMDETDVNA